MLAIGFCVYVRVVEKAIEQLKIMDMMNQCTQFLLEEEDK